MLTQLHGLAHGGENFFAHHGGLGGGGFVVAVQAHAHHHELVAAYARDGVFATHAALQPARHFLQQQVAVVVAQGVVDELEVVEVDEQQRAVLALACAGGAGLLHAVEQHAAVGQAGERVDEGQVADLLLGVAARGDVFVGDDGAAPALETGVGQGAGAHQEPAFHAALRAQVFQLEVRGRAGQHGGQAGFGVGVHRQAAGTAQRQIGLARGVLPRRQHPVLLRKGQPGAVDGDDGARRVDNGNLLLGVVQRGERGDVEFSRRHRSPGGTTRRPSRGFFGVHGGTGYICGGPIFGRHLQRPSCEQRWFHRPDGPRPGLWEPGFTVGRTLRAP